MPNYTGLRREANSARVIDGLTRLRDALDQQIGVRSRDKTLRLASWNIREFDSPSYGPRVADSYYFLAEVVSRFDLVAVQEVRRDLAALQRLIRHLGPGWDYLVTDVTEGRRGNTERLAFVYDRGKVNFTGLAGELVLPPVQSSGADVPAKQVARTPFTAGFRSGWVEFELSTVHIVYGEDRALSPERIEEIGEVAMSLAKRADDPGTTPNQVLLGDFNIYARTDATMTAMTDAGWRVPPQLQTVPGSNVAKDKYYDQIAVLSRAHQFHPAGPAGVFDYFEHVFRDEDEATYAADIGPKYLTKADGTPRDERGRRTYYRAWRTFQMSDHLPMWIDLKVDYSTEYLTGLAPPPQPIQDPTGPP